MFRQLTFLAGLTLVAVSTAAAEPYWITYEGNDLPENEGWTRFTSNGEANRHIEDGALVINSLHDRHIEDIVYMERWMDPEPGEMFVAEWRLMVAPVSTGPDAGVAIARSFEPGFVVFSAGASQARNALDQLYWPIEPGVYHTYRLESEDMIGFRFLIDGVVTQVGMFQDAAGNQSYISFGDKYDGWASLSYWDYVRFGVIPEPSTHLMILVAIGVTSRTLRQLRVKEL